MTEPQTDRYDVEKPPWVETSVEPRPLDPRTVKVWRIEAAIESTVALLIGAAATILLLRLDVHVALSSLPVVFALLYGVINVVLLPWRRWKSWRYAIGNTEIELRHGIWWQTWTRIPMARVQHVDTRRGPLERRFGLASLVVYTAAGSRQIPGLAIEVAEEGRDRIARLANVRDDV